MAFILMPLYTLYLTTREYGIMDMSIIVINFIFPLATIMINGGVLRFGFERPDRIKYYATEGTIITALSCVAVALLLPLTRLSWFGGLSQYMWLFFISYVTSSFPNYFGVLCRVVNEIKMIPIASIATAASMFSLTYLFLVHLHMGIVGYFYAYIISNIISTFFYFFGAHLYRFLSFHEWEKYRKELRRPLLRYSLPLAPNAVCDTLGMTMSRFLITSQLGVGFSGLYAAASKIPNLMSIFQQIFNQAWQISSFQEYKEKNISSFYSVIWKAYCALLTTGCSLVILCAAPIAQLLLQREFFSAWRLIPILCFAFFFGATSGFLGSIYQTYLKPKPLLIQSIIGAATCIFVTWISLSNQSGLIGASLAVLCGNLLMFVIRLIDSRRLLSFELGLRAFLPTLVILGGQTYAVTRQISHTNLISLGCFVAIVILQCTQLLPFAKMLAQRKHKPTA